MSKNKKFGAVEIAIYIGVVLLMVLIAGGNWGFLHMADENNRNAFEMASTVALGGCNLFFISMLRENISSFYGGLGLTMSVLYTGIVSGAAMITPLAAFTALVRDEPRFLIAVLMTTLTAIMLFNFIARKKLIAIHRKYTHDD